MKPASMIARSVSFPKKGISKSSLPTAYFAFWRFVIAHPLFCGEVGH